LVFTTQETKNEKKKTKKERKASADVDHRQIEHIDLPAKLLDYFLRSNTSNINQSTTTSRWAAVRDSLDRFWLRGSNPGVSGQRYITLPIDQSVVGSDDTFVKFEDLLVAT